MNLDKSMFCSIDCWGKSFKEFDVVHKPKHYNLYQTEVIDVIKQMLTREEYIGYLKGNMLKYRLRAGLKDNRQQDLDKSNWYQDRLNKEEGLDKCQ